MKLFVGNLPWAATEESLKKFFEQVGEVLSVKIITDPYTGRSRGFGFVEMKNAEQGQEALNKLNEVVFLDRAIRVSQARQEGSQQQGGGARTHRPRRENGRREGGSYSRSNEGSSGYNSYHDDEE